ncbi:MAG: hypothetical protein ACYC5M_03845 [Anaerolineae bacterium]
MRGDDVQGTITWVLSHSTLVGIAVVVLAVVGFQRGANRELTTMLGIGAGILLSGMLSGMLAPTVARVVRVAAAASEAGKGILETQVAPLLILGVVVLGFVVYGQLRVPGPRSIVSRLLGLVAGGINGYLIAYFVLPRMTGKPVTAVAAQSGAGAAGGGDSAAWLVVALVGVLIAFGLYSSSAPKGHE